MNIGSAQIDTGGSRMALSESELIDSIERLDEIAATLQELRHRFVQELEAIENRE